MSQQTQSQQQTEQSEVVLSPFCRELRSKRYYSLQAMPTEENHLLDPSTHCWCRKTMQAVGPDGEKARPGECKPGRSCYRSLFAE